MINEFLKRFTIPLSRGIRRNALNINLTAIALLAGTTVNADEHKKFGDWTANGGRVCGLYYSGWKYELSASAVDVGYVASYSVRIKPGIFGISFRRNKIDFYGEEAKKITVNNGHVDKNFWIGWYANHPDYPILTEGPKDFFGTDLRSLSQS